MSDAKLDAPPAGALPAEPATPAPVAVDPEATPAQNHKVSVKSADMTDEMRTKVVKVITDAFDANKQEKDIAAQIKRESDRQFGATWHAIVGRNFGSYVTH
ncbi:hypothetical protein EV182_008239, partial [Spiromyces aspiralis]